MTKRIRVGVGGWTFAPWRDGFYPSGLTQKRELEYASSRLTSIEINGTFYGPQKPATFAKWRDETPEDFVFAVKAPRYATHRRDLSAAGPTIERFLQGGLLELQHKLGPINWQLMPSTSFDAAAMEAFFQLLPEAVAGQPLRHAIEVRHPSFRTAAFVALARRYKVGIVIAGDSKYPQIADITGDFVYLRIMGTTAGKKLGYAPAALDRWVERVRRYAAGAVPPDLGEVMVKTSQSIPHEVFLYVISGHKELNPAAACAIIERLNSVKKQ